MNSQQNLTKKTKDELLRMAKSKKIKNYSAMDKKALVGILSKKTSSKAKTTKAKKTVVAKKPARRRSLIKGILTKAALKESKAAITKKEPTPAYTTSVYKEKVEEAKFSTPYLYSAQPESEFQFPCGYGDNKIVIMARDPWWVYAYWEITDQREAEVKRQISKQNLTAIKSILRIYDVTDIDFNGKNANSYFDIKLSGLAKNWYVNTGIPNRAYCVDIGILTKEGKFFTLARSNVVRTPRYGMSDVFDEEWMCAEEDYWRMFGLSGGFGIGRSSLEMKEMFKKRLLEQITSGVSSISSPMKRVSVSKGFWLVVDAELIVYGATEPDAKVTVCGRPIQLKKDGSFSLRFSLPDGKQVIPVEATSSDGKDKRKITPTVSRHTEK